jgi:hypothetical protein
MSSRSDRTVDEENDPQIISPFAQTTSTLRSTSPRMGISWPLWIVSGMLVLVIFGNAVYFAFKYLNDPYRTLPPFSVDNYLADFQPLTGSKFKADFKLVADLGWKENVGRLLVFTASNDNRPILVLIPPKLSGVFFSKDQTYRIDLTPEVGHFKSVVPSGC